MADRWARTVWQMLLGVALLATAALVLPLDDLVTTLAEKIRALGPAGPPVYAALFVYGAVLFVPVTPMVVASGWLFGHVWGAVVASLSATTAAAVSFTLGRRLLRPALEGRIRQSPKLSALSTAIGHEGWKLVVLLRLSPVIPFGLGNLFYGTTTLRLRDYLIASWVAMLPGTILYTLVGATGRKLLTASGPPAELPYLVVGIAATLAAVIWTTIVARRELRRETVTQKDSSPVA